MTTTSVPPTTSVQPHVSDSALGELPDRIVVSTAHGRVRIDPSASSAAEGEFVRAGAIVARVSSDGREVDVCAPSDAWIVDYLIRDGQRVHPGVPIVHLRTI